jgi:hypothetical protein
MIRVENGWLVQSTQRQKERTTQPLCNKYDLTICFLLSHLQAKMSVSGYIHVTAKINGVILP